MPACVEPALAEKLKGRVTSVIHREDVVPRLSFTNLMKLREQFNRDDEKEWCRQQIEKDVECLWRYVGWPKGDKDKLLEEVQGVKSAGSQATPGSGDDRARGGAGVSARNIAGDLVCPGYVIHLRERPESGQYEAALTDMTDPLLQRIMVSARSFRDHNMQGYLDVFRGLRLRARLTPPPPSPTASASAPTGASGGGSGCGGAAGGDGRAAEHAVDAEGNWRPCSICLRDVCEISILKSDAHRALATKNCKDCGRICCAECAPAGDVLPDFSRELWATRTLNDERVVLPQLGQP
ncbi:hypothetical protein T484DRAFT_2559787 [Baffinella frigidus]|nr:hypothetical protein T484DRAFT_2559787 [Cryptophyta sp. CCMP2293]